MNSLKPDVLIGIRETVLWSDVRRFFARYDGLVDELDETHPIRLLAEARALYEDEDIEALRNDAAESQEEHVDCEEANRRLVTGIRDLVETKRISAAKIKDELLALVDFK